eukprot:CAMPEP_0170507446 /NCGR_PEP_ID=MMETSP0208-20121228/58840_1 /TAXON_ID=197538 /ORGANISM="Strombidium inclinatum, Strain S3" /LENGTH=109 /DNA_ID=CAMNT_0010789627 /DNA_START=224 /DNA_END=550 /DNA_ORIENTATION=+
MQQSEQLGSHDGRRKKKPIVPKPSYEYQRIRKERLFNYAASSKEKDETISEKVQVLENQKHDMLEQLRQQEQEIKELQRKKEALAHLEESKQIENPIQSSFWNSCDEAD